MRLEGRSGLVTGGASGIGAATAVRLASEGARVVVADIDADGAGKVAAEAGGEAVEMDVKDVESVRAAIASAARIVGPIDILVNNAGTDRFAFFVDTDEETWDHVLGTNLRGTLACTHAVLPGMQERHRGAIVNVASEAGVVGTLAGATYAASKAGILGFTKAIARESARYAVRCNAVAPGPIDTPLLGAAVDESGALGARLRQGMIDATAMHRLGTPEEVAGAIAFLASDDASFVTGHTLTVSGGLSML
jgi:2-hydroxycyclohexanecarboxyl-CoA dehydrogenase